MYNKIVKTWRNLQRRTLHVQKFILVILMVGMFAFIHIQRGPNISNNFGIKCQELQTLIQMGDTKQIGSKFTDAVYRTNHIIQERQTMNQVSISIELRPLLNCLEPDDMYLEKVLKDSYLVPPARKSETYNVSSQNSLEMSSQPQAVDVMEMVYKNKLTNGFFVEAGAADCEFSVSLPLENNYGWTGVLVEMSPVFFKKCNQKRRKSYVINTCLGIEPRAHFTQFNIFSSGVADAKTKTRAMAGFHNAVMNHNSQEGVLMVQCFNLESILYAVGNPTVNLFVLDIEGYELAVLRSIRWEKVDIEVLSVEIDLAGIIMKESSPQIIQELLESKGYTRFHHRNDMNQITNKHQNALFVRDDIVKKYDVKQL